MAESRPVLEIVTGTPRSGKTYTVVCWMWDLYRSGYSGTLWTNLPLVADKWEGVPIREIDYLSWIKSAREYDSFSKKSFAPGRVSRRPSPVELVQAVAPSTVGPPKLLGPWSLGMEDGDLLVVDEAHKVIPNRRYLAYREHWKDWVSEVGHQGVTVVLITQDFKMIDAEVKALAEQRTTCVNRGGLKNPFIGVQMRYFYDVWEAWTGKACHVFQKDVFVRYNEKWVRQESKPVPASEERFALYVSRSASYTTGAGAGTYEKKSKKQTTVAFFRVAWFELAWRSLVACLLAALISGNAGFIFGGLAKHFQNVANRGKVKEEAKPPTAPGVVEAAVVDVAPVQRDFVADMVTTFAAGGLVLESVTPAPQREYRTDKEIRAVYRVKKIGRRVWLTPRYGEKKQSFGAFSRGVSAAGSGVKQLGRFGQ